MGVCFRDSLRDLALAQCQDDGVPAVAVLVGAGVVVEPPVVVPPLPPFALRHAARSSRRNVCRAASSFRSSWRRFAIVASDLVAIRTQRLLRTAQLREILFELRRIAALQVLPNGVPILVDRLHLAAHGAHRTVQSLTSLPHGLHIALHCAPRPR